MTDLDALRDYTKNLDFKEYLQFLNTEMNKAFNSTIDHLQDTQKTFNLLFTVLIDKLEEFKK